MSTLLLLTDKGLVVLIFPVLPFIEIIAPCLSQPMPKFPEPTCQELSPITQVLLLVVSVLLLVF